MTEPQAPDLVRAAYEALPESIKERISFNAYCWLPDDEKHRLIQRETEPDYDE
jgi:IS5 family transposase